MTFAHGYFPLLMNERVNAIVASVMEVPLHRHLAIGLIDQQDPARGIELTVDQRHLNNVGVLHGGVFPACLDVAAYLAVLPELAPDSHATTVSNTTSIARGARAGDVIRFEGAVTRVGRTLAFTSARASVDGAVIATCELVKAIVPARPDQA